MFKFTVRPDEGEPYELEAGARDVLVWEQGGRDRSVSLLMRNTKLADAYAVAYAAARRQGLFGGSQREFETGVDLVLGVAPEADPT